MTNIISGWGRGDIITAPPSSSRSISPPLTSVGRDGKQERKLSINTTHVDKINKEQTMDSSGEEVRVIDIRGGGIREDKWGREGDESEGGQGSAHQDYGRQHL